MKNTTIASVSGSGKSLKRWRSGLMALFALLCVTAGFSQTGTIGIGSGAATNVYMPIRAYYGYSYSQQIVTAAEYSAGGGVAGQITKIRYYITNTSTPLANWNNWTVYIGQTSKTAFSSNTDWEPVANLTQVFTGTVTQTANSWMEITLTTPFTYNGTSNLVVAVDENAALYSDADVNFGSYASAANTGIYYYNDTTNPVPASPPTGTRTGTVARLQFEGSVASCLAPTGVTALATSANAANVTYTASASVPANGYQYYYSTSATAPTATTTPSGTLAAGVTSVPLTGLTANTTYYVWARSACGATTNSNWSTVATFATPCDATTVTYTQDFESVTVPAIPECTSIQNAAIANNWATSNNPGSGFTNKTLQYSYGTSVANAWFYTRGVTLTAGTSYRLSYKYGNQYTFYTEKLKVAYGTANVNTSMTTVLADHNVTGAAANTTYVDFTPATSGVYYVGFNAYSPAYQGNMYVDDIVIALSPTCVEPGSITANVVTTTSGAATWTAPTVAPGVGYEYYVATTNTAPLAGATATGSVAAGILTTPISGLMPNTTYYVWVRSVCSASDKSAWKGTASFYTGYCTPAPSSQDGIGITNFAIGGINNTTVSETGYYGNYSAQVASLSVGTTANFSVSYGTGFTYGTKIWVDWNDDLDFNDAGEQVYFGLSTNANPTTLTGSFVIPATAPLGNHRMRVGGTDNDLGGTPCYAGAYGTYEDYTLNTFMPPAPVITGFTPASYCAATGVITITGTDLGTATLSIGGTAVTPLTTNTATQIVATVPAGVNGTVAVTTVAGTATSTTTFNVSAPAAFTLSDDAETICNGAATAAVTITTGAASFDTYVWAPATGVSGSAATGWTFNPTATTEYVLTASQSAGPCLVNATFTVTVNPLPNAVVVAPATANACINQPVMLTATGGESIIATTYCTPSLPTANVGASGDYLNNFSFANVTNNNSGDALTDYTYYSALTANVTGGSSYTLSLQSGNATWTQYFRVWIDYNGNGAFEDAESVYNSTTGVTSTTTLTSSITIPATAINGVTRMRVLCSYSAASLVSSDCAWTGYGEFEDYKVNITGATNAVDYVWTPATGLYTDAAATVPYVAGASAQVVYAVPAASVTYSASASTPLGCSISGTSVLTVYNTPAPTATSPQAFTVMTYPANLAATGTGIQWYTSATGGTPLTATSEIWTGTYYASQTLNGCESSTRAAVEVSVILPEMDWVNLQWPAALTVAQGTTGEVFAQGYEPAVTPGAGPGTGVQAWIGVSTSNTNPSTWTTWIPMTYNAQVGNNDEFVATLGTGLTQGTYYYASRFKLLDGPYKYGGYSAEGGSFWNGTSYVSGVLTVTCATSAPVAAASQTFCNSATVSGLQATGTAVQWYTAATGGTALSNTTALVNGTTYYASQTVGCESLTRTAVTVTITNTPAPTGDATQEFTVEGWVSGLEATGTGIQWYAAATGGAPLTGTTALVNGMVYYASQTVNGCESQTRFAVTVTLAAYTLDFVNLQWPAEVSVIQGSDATVYAQVYEANVTPGAGPGVGVTVMVGISAENTDPSTWTTWLPMTFNTQVGSNDEWMAMIGANLAPGTYYYAVSGMLNNGPATYGGYSATGGGTWNGTTNASGVINVICYTAAPYTVANQQVFCNSATVASLSATGSEIQWYAAATGGEPLAADAAVVDGMIYYASQTVNGCTSVGRVAVTAYISNIAAPTGEATQTVYYTATTPATVNDIVVESDGTVVWYASEEDAMSGDNPIATDAGIEAGIYYGVTTVGDCNSTTAFAVTVDVVLGNDEFDRASFSYYPNPVNNVLTISYSKEITSVTVFNLLGQMVLYNTPNAIEAKLDMTALAEGAYIVNVAAGNTVKTIKVVKKQ